MSTSLDEKGYAMKEVVSSFQLGIRKMASKIQSSTKAESALAKPYGKVAVSLERLAKTEEHEPLKRTLESLSVCISDIQECRENILVERMDQLVAEKLVEMDKLSVIPTKLMLDDRESALKSMAKKKQQYRAMMQKNALDSKIEQKFTELENDTKRAHNINASVDSNILKYEEQRVSDMKELLEEMIRSHIYFHCKSLEMYSQVLASVQDLNGQEALRDLKNALENCDDSVAAQSNASPVQETRRKQNS